MTLAHHNAAHGYKRRSGEAELFGAQQSGNHYVFARMQFAIYLNANTAAEVVHDENLLSFGKAEFPRTAGVLDGGKGGGARAAIVATD